MQVWKNENGIRNKRCTECHGEGMINNKPCQNCGGKGFAETIRDQYERQCAKDLEKWETWEKTAIAQQ